MGFASKYRNELGLLVAIICVVGFTLVFNKSYLEAPGRNLTNILHQTALLGIFALGAAIVIIVGGIDLSSGSMIVFAASVCALVLMACAPVDPATGTPQTDDITGWWPVVLAIGATLIVGLMVGTLHTWLITVVQLPPFVATLASLVGLRSFAKVLNPAVSKVLGSEVTKVRADAESFVLLSEWWVALTVFLVLSAACYFLMSHTVWGRHLYALGGNEEAARLSGIRTNRMKWLAYSIGSVTASIAGILYLAKIGAANPATLGVGYELNAIAATVVGGCSLRGGIGLIPGVMLGVLFLRVVIDSINKVVRNGSDDYQGMIVGFLVVLAVAVNELRRGGGGGQRKQFFPGMLGVAVIPILSLLVALVLFVMYGTSAGLMTFVSVLVILSSWKITESMSARR
ncbi:MAG: ribose ABC transporter permease [Blastopirellula sp.]|nr:ribose ABC transporter permease [Blastopirellula sp.]